jgi:hypothetical protein
MPAPEFRDAWLHGVLSNQTVRIIVRSSLSGSRIRIRLSNAFGTHPLIIGAAHIAAVPSGTAQIMNSAAASSAAVSRGVGNSPSIVRLVIPDQDKEIAGTDRMILFGGRPSVIIAPGETAISDPMDFETRGAGFLAVSLYLPNKTEPATVVGSATTASVFQGDATAMASETSVLQRGPARGSLWLSSVEVFGSAESTGIMIIDDDSRWRDGLSPGAGWQVPLMDRLLSNGGSNRFAVLNSSMNDCPLIGNCRPTAVERIQEAARNQEGVKWVILATGFDDILNASYDSGVLGQAPLKTTVEDVIATLREIIAEAHAAGLRITGVTYPPFFGTPRYTEKGDAMREAVNEWIRAGGAFDAVADFDRAVRDPNYPSQRQSLFVGENPAFLGNLGFQAMANSIDASVLTR